MKQGPSREGWIVEEIRAFMKTEGSLQFSYQPANGPIFGQTIPFQTLPP
jgi:hypothetical protein